VAFVKFKKKKHVFVDEAKNMGMCMPACSRWDLQKIWKWSYASCTKDFWFWSLHSFSTGYSIMFPLL